MTTNLCPFGDDDAPQRYVAGTLPSDAAEAFEIHLLGCAGCQRLVEEASALRAALRVRATPRRTPRLLWATATAAAIVVAVALLRGPNGFEQLGRTAAPPFSGVLARSDPDSASQGITDGLTAYSGGDYRRAAALLGSAQRASAEPGVAFLLGAARLMSGDRRGAITAFHAASEPAGNPYAAEARYYAAKAWLQLGRADSALAELRGAPRAAALRALADSIAARMR